MTLFFKHLLSLLSWLSIFCTALLSLINNTYIKPCFIILIISLYYSLKLLDKCLSEKCNIIYLKSYTEYIENRMAKEKTDIVDDYYKLYNSEERQNIKGYNSYESE